MEIISLALLVVVACAFVLVCAVCHQYEASCFFSAHYQQRSWLEKLLILVERHEILQTLATFLVALFVGSFVSAVTT